MSIDIHAIRMKIVHDFGIFLPINGGMGNSIDNPITIEKTIPILVPDAEPEFQKTPVKVEHLYLKYVFTGRNVEYKFLKQELIEHGGKKIDKVKCETKETTDAEIITQIENYYFDISEFMT